MKPGGSEGSAMQVSDVEHPRQKEQKVHLSYVGRGKKSSFQTSDSILPSVRNYSEFFLIPIQTTYPEKNTISAES